MNRTHIVFIFLASTFISLFMSSCAHPKVSPPKYEADKFCVPDDFKSKITIIQPEKTSIKESIHLTGSVAHNPDKVVHFTSLVDGVISRTFFSEGDIVHKGQVLAELSSNYLTELYARLKTIKAQLKVMQQLLEVSKIKHGDGLASANELLNAQSEVDILNAEKEKIETQLSLFNASQGKGVFLIKAPQSGTIISKNIATGESVSASGERLFTISDLTNVWVMVDIYSSDIKNISQGMDVEIRTLSYSDEKFTGKIDHISQALDKQSKVLKARVKLPNPGFRLKPGMFVDVNALKMGEETALNIPTHVLIFDNNQHYVIIYKSDCDLEIRKVEILATANSYTYVSDGLEEGETIVSQNHLLLYEQIKNFQN